MAQQNGNISRYSFYSVMIPQQSFIFLFITVGNIIINSIELIFQSQKMQKKIPFGVKILKRCSFLKLIQDWVQSLDIDVFIHQQYFKYFPRFIVDLQTSFTTSIIKYALLKRFPLLVHENVEADLLQLSRGIKQTYAIMNINIIMKLDSYFYFLSVFLTKVIAQFLKDTFIDIEVQKNLQSQVYIILVYAIIGLEVAPKTYQINHKKIIYQKYSIKNKPKSLCKIQTVDTLHQKPSSNKIANLKVPKRLIVDRKWTNVSCKEDRTQTPLDQFKQSLKENLAVKALPKLIKKKIKGCDFDYNADKHQAEMKGDQNKYIFLREDQSVSKPSQQFINSNQNSSSFDFLFKNNNENQCFIHRNVKISHRPQLLINNKSLKTENFLNSAIKTPQQKKQLNFDDKSSKNWKDIIKQIRQNSLQTNKINHFIRTSSEGFHDFWQREQKLNPVSLLQRAYNDEVQSQRDREYVLVSKPIKFGAYNIQERQKHLGHDQGTSQSSRLLRTNKLRKQRHMFEKSCEKRFYQTHSSMFNITNPPYISLHISQ